MRQNVENVSRLALSFSLKLLYPVLFGDIASCSVQNRVGLGLGLGLGLFCRELYFEWNRTGMFDDGVEIKGNLF